MFKQCVRFVFTSQDNPPYPGGQAHFSTADALFPVAKGFATCIENEWSLQRIQKKMKQLSIYCTSWPVVNSTTNGNKIKQFFSQFSVKAFMLI